MTADDLEPMTRAELFFRDLLADCMSSALASQWRQRAQQFRDARPRPGDFPGRTTVEQRRDQWRRLTRLADMCEAHADLLGDGVCTADLIPEGVPRMDILIPEIDDVPIWEAA